MNASCSRTGYRAAPLVLVLLAVTLAGAVDRASGQCEPACGKQNIECLNPGPEYDNRTAVGQIITPAGLFCCTGWIIAEPNFILTNRHCITTNGQVDGPLGDVTTMTLRFNLECDACAGGAQKPTTVFNITGLVHQNIALDYAILTTSGDPAATWGVLTIDPSPPVVGEAVYEIHHAGCQVKGYDDGMVTTPVGSGLCIGSTTAEFGVDIIATGGASGAPIFRESNHCVVGICHCGPDCAPGFGVPMSAIWPDADGFILAAGGVPHLCVCGDFLSGECYVANGSPGCSDEDCCNDVCAIDPFCCNTTWDAACVNEALSLCGDCGSPAAGDCFTNNGTPGCDDLSCCGTVCAIDDFCCNNSWDGICAGIAMANCTPPNNACVNATAVFDGQAVNGFLTAATPDGDSTCDPGVNPDVWYRFVAPCDGLLRANTCGTHDTPAVDAGMDTILSVHSACPGTEANQLACDDDNGPPACVGGAGLLRDSSVEITMTAGQEVFIRVTHFGGAVADGLFVLNIDFAQPNDDCVDAAFIFNGSTDFCNVGATTDGPGCMGMTNDIWYRYTAPFTGDVTVSTCGSAFDTVLAVYDGCACPPGAELACNDQFACDGAASSQSQVTVPVVVGQCYLIQVGGWLGNSGQGSILISKDFQPCGPGAGSCFHQHPTPGCDDEVCCNVVCAVDAFCCNNSWDALCRSEAMQFCVNPCPGDCAEPPDSQVDVTDLLKVLADWGLAVSPCEIDGNGIVDVGDLLQVLGAWGPCGPAACDDCVDGSVDSCGAAGADCFECITPDGGCLCVENQLCLSYEPCVDGECPPGFACCVNTCCGTPVCVPVCDGAVGEADADRSAAPAPSPTSGGPIGGPIGGPTGSRK